jgi:putative SOS response-associated peptidase YedK
MCGRYTYFSTSGWSDKQDLQHALAQDRLSTEAIQTWNAAPGTDLPVVVLDADADALRARLMRWGLVPAWAKDPRVGFNMINARSETIATKAAYREPLRRTRCLVPASGFYEWERTGERGGSPKIPHHYTHADGSPCVMAGVWTTWVDRATGEVLDSYSIITRGADDVVAPVHDRMPVLLGAGADMAWLDPGASGEQLEELLRTVTAPPLVDDVASTMVNSSRNDGPQLLIADPPADVSSADDAAPPTLFDI